ncbi:hypothetical protein BGX24_006640, partial [Mortierella sp. AD032]
NLLRTALVPSLASSQLKISFSGASRLLTTSMAMTLIFCSALYLKRGSSRRLPSSPKPLPGELLEDSSTSSQSPWCLLPSVAKSSSVAERR